ncbi:TIGR01621 family pseudouridine synthase [Aeromonas simiae]|uniref:TIGR01621 family pseudouridine synthase n=1 Tax=Aeromonas simiae TaxID=218936 RepID=A0A5J6WVU2_9GAMM|nr:TIGR01621 family pseudouridine synthase [Aeromonas simiae]QFI54327.1 TIGR01621 family pseudouridine synthase [Aeromonas simiae]
MFRELLRHPDFLLIDKSPGIGMHEENGAPGLVTLVREATGLALYPVHRLDKMTSGLLLLARHPEANRALSQGFAERRIKKQYLALSDRRPIKKQGLIKGDMKKGRGGSWMLTRSQDNPAISRFDSSLVREGLRLFRIRPETGKTHQIRVALKSVGAPILGDERYGGTPAERGYLHAWRLNFTYGGEAFDFVCPPEVGEAFLLPETRLAIEALAP